MAERKTREELERDWWEKWRKEDYSWDGLKSKYIAGWKVVEGALVESDKAPMDAPSATLQDYWRSEEGNWEEGDGKKYLLPHVPMKWSDGTDAKAGWDDEKRKALSALIQSRLDLAKPMTFVGDKVSEKKTRERNRLPRAIARVRRLCAARCGWAVD